MILYRFSHKKFARDLSGNGARLFGGRWNPAGIPVIYTSSSISLALLEVLANAHTLIELKSIQLMEIEVPDQSVSTEIKLQSLKKNWYLDYDYTQWLGKEIILANKSLVCQCPSAIVHREPNFLINTQHAEFKKIKLLNSADFYFDERLFNLQQQIN
jgi:RES domain-containing protein